MVVLDDSVLVVEFVVSEEVLSVSEPLMVMTPTPCELISKAFVSPLTFTVTAPGTPDWIFNVPFTVIFFDHGPVTLSATVYVPSSFTSSQLACPSGTLISTSFVSVLVSVVVSGFFDSEESFLVSVVLLVSEAFVEEVFSCVLDSLFTLTVREGTGFVLLVVHVRTEKMIISVNNGKRNDNRSNGPRGVGEKLIKSTQNTTTTRTAHRTR